MLHSMLRVDDTNRCYSENLMSNSRLDGMSWDIIIIIISFFFVLFPRDVLVWTCCLLSCSHVVNVLAYDVYLFLQFDKILFLKIASIILKTESIDNQAENRSIQGTQNMSLLWRKERKSLLKRYILRCWAGLYAGVKIRWALGPIALKIWWGPTKCLDQGPKWPTKMLAYFNTWCVKVRY